MPHVQYWARVRAGMDCPLRRGAWYRVVELTPGETVLEVNSRLLRDTTRRGAVGSPSRPALGPSIARAACALSERRSICEFRGVRAPGGRACHIMSAAGGVGL